MLDLVPLGGARREVADGDLQAGAAVAVRADVADDLDVQRLFAETIAAFGGIDVVVHAVASPVTTAPVAEVDLDVFDALVRISTRATFVVNREAARHLRNGGAIVNLTSSADSLSLTAYGLYTAAKAATDVLTRALAVELRERDITVNAVCIDVDTPCAPHRAADVVAYLLSDHGHRLTGHVLRVGDSRPAPYELVRNNRALPQTQSSNGTVTSMDLKHLIVPLGPRGTG